MFRGRMEEEVEGWAREIARKSTVMGLTKEESGLAKGIKSCGQEELSPG